VNPTPQCPTAFGNSSTGFLPGERLDELNAEALARIADWLEPLADSGIGAGQLRAQIRPVHARVCAMRLLAEPSGRVYEAVLTCDHPESRFDRPVLVEARTGEVIDPVVCQWTTLVHATRAEVMGLPARGYQFACLMRD